MWKQQRQEDQNKYILERKKNGEKLLTQTYHRNKIWQIEMLFNSFRLVCDYIVVCQCKSIGKEALSDIK